MTQQRVAVVTGASRGVGKGIAVELGAAGHVVYVTGRSTDGRVTYPSVGGTVEETARAVTAAGGRGVGVVCDHTDDAQVAALFDRVRQESGGLDVLVNNVWGGYAAYHEDRYADMSGPFWEQPLSVWDDMFAAGVRAHYAATVLAVPLLRPGSLVATVSFFPGSYPSADDQVAYSVAKAADDRLVAATAAQLEPRGVTAVGVYPGLVRTEGVMRAADYFDLSNSESPRFVGRAVAALAADPDVARHRGRCLVVAELAERYGFTDVDGTRAMSAREHFAQRPPLLDGA
ncbi:SDR family NAD(P)-dependent oxidoreductase [Spirilliplanes yamanashiensis]|uniref:Oxidoreductase n=1 Tax=Spirilliplanes yamanashiensis TaxID=42233 RepID=A0A8J3Y5P0_9ACTN|nr:SDR family NAD(P)-dependent oxidoreductase [Spirilliplanes yamanashiensis]MDP9819396.1 NAD(P)-dependent dehydrogenase (short-subunit alcohol dehydrogenase family) [Spirilliplanes yamanashiensis]GIJ01780.1 oxidoreductase [Spirilliplanes yamanashiensis]